MAKKSVADTIKDYEIIKKYLQDEASYLRNINDLEGERAKNSEIISDRQKMINELLNNSSTLTNSQKKYLDDLINLQRQEIANEKAINAELNKQVKHREHLVDLGKEFVNLLASGWKYLQDQDKIMKSTILNLGMSGTKAELIRGSFEKSAGFVTRLGGSLEDIQKIMEGYADETGRARVLSADMVKDITAIGKGTGLGIEQATKLGAQFELMGFSARGTMDYVQGVVDTSERMGVNTTKVLKNISDNFKKLQTYNFQQGVKGFSQMAQFAEKFKIDIGDALNAADTARTLEGAIDMVAQLQVMGGEFAKLDMFETLYFARNDPAKLQAKIADMSKGIVTLRKNSDGMFEKFISPADRDRLAAAGKALGISNEKMTEMALRAFDIGKMSQQLQGMGLTDREKELIQGASFMNQETGKFQVELAGTMTDIGNLTADQAKSFAKEQVLLQDRAKEAMTFDETFKATINTLKSALLPLLKGVNTVLGWVKPLVDGLSKLAGSGWGGVAIAAGTLLSAGLLWKIVSFRLGESVKAWSTMQGKKEGGGNIFARMFNKSNAGASTPAAGAAPAGAAPSFGSGAGAGLKSLGAGAGIGVALAGAGAGVGLAAEGISKLADSMSKLTKEQADTLKSIVSSLSWFMVGAAGAAVGIMALGAAGYAGSIGLLALGAAFVGIGFGINLATKGIGVMSQGLATMFTAMKGTGPDIAQAATGIAGIAAALGVASLTLGGGIGLALTLGTIAKHAEKIISVAPSIEKITTALKGTKEDFTGVKEALESLSNIKVKSGGAIGELITLLKTPLKVDFSQSSVPIRNNITLELDGKQLLNKSLDGELMIAKHIQALHGNNKPS